VKTNLRRIPSCGKARTGVKSVQTLSLEPENHMELQDVAPLAVWAELEEEARQRFGLSCHVYNIHGNRITGSDHPVNALCPEIRKSPGALTAICAVGSQNFIQMARLTNAPVIGQCDAGLVKLAVPVFVDGEFLGTAGACGLMPEDGEIEEFLLEKTAGISGGDAARLAKDIPVISEERAGELAEFLRRRVAEIAIGFTGDKES
jgi:ligand-binding sensor protein